MFRSNAEKVLYSCVVDNSPEFYYQGVIFITTLIEIAKVKPDCIYIHMIGVNSSFEEFLDNKGVNKIFISPWGDEKYCNKLQQIDTPELQDADFVFLCDADIAFLENISSAISHDKITGKTVDFDNPEINLLKSIFSHYKLNNPLENSETLNGQPTFDGNFNGGLYGIPGKYFKKFGRCWKHWTETLLQSNYILQILSNKVIHIDQISFCMALQELDYPYSKLNISYNCPTHIENFALLQNQLNERPSVLHHHSELSPVGRLKSTGLEMIDSSINRVNHVLKKNHIEKLCWEFHYKMSSELSKQSHHPNDINNDNIVLFLNKYSEVDTQLLYESVSISRDCFGWYTKHLPRIYEYPWLLRQIGYDINAKRIADFGAGITPLPVSLSMRGANVVTFDNNEKHIKLYDVKTANEWGFFDYSTLGLNIQSLNTSLSKNIIEDNYFDIWYSISVVEHMPADIRREIFAVMYNTLKRNGKLLLTVDLIQGTRSLWNMAGGLKVECDSLHGTLDGLVLELESFGFNNICSNIIIMPDTENVDIATISAEVNK